VPATAIDPEVSQVLDRVVETAQAARTSTI
jgi:hypothetical protein